MVVVQFSAQSGTKRSVPSVYFTIHTSVAIRVEERCPWRRVDHANALHLSSTQCLFFDGILFVTSCTVNMWPNRFFRLRLLAARARGTTTIEVIGPDGSRHLVRERAAQELSEDTRTVALPGDVFQRAVELFPTDP